MILPARHGYTHPRETVVHLGAFNQKMNDKDPFTFSVKCLFTILFTLGGISPKMLIKFYPTVIVFYFFQ